MGWEKKVLVEDIEPLVHEYKGNVAAIARKFGVSRGTIWNRVQESTTLRAAFEDARESMVDNAESSLYNKVLKGEDTTALIFFLKTQGRRRGYGDSSTNFNIDPSALTDEQLMRIIAGEDPLSVIRS
jgi:hypothetical protein